MSSELKIGGKSFVVDDPGDSLMRATSIECKEQHQEYTTSDTLVSFMRPEPKSLAPIKPSSLAPEDMARSRVALYERLASGGVGLPGMLLMWLFVAIPAISMGWVIWIQCTNSLPVFSVEPGHFILRMLVLIVGDGFLLAAFLIMTVCTLLQFGRRKSSS